MADPRRIAFSMVDVFAPRPLTGNPAAVVADAAGLTLEQMQALAREFNQSETVFIVAADDDRADWQFRSFTPIGAEVGGAGHNALAACLWLVDRRLPVDRTEFVVQIGADLLHTAVTRPTDGPAMVTVQQSPPAFGTVLTDRDALTDALGLTPADLTEDAIQVISTGAGHLLVPLVDRAAVDRAQPDTRRLAAVLKTVAGEGCYLYSLDTAEGDSAAYARFFNPTMGITEDPATGTAAGPLVAKLVAEGRVAPGAPAIVEQGHSLGRPSRILITVDGANVRISGAGLIVADGTVLV
ncbi:PhzF family phenazine biosynthesis protein [Knoellia sp. CPCC 206453]|uniref:PhzF family phenazine biosynthesis protein n=1 Tax=Knoellia pratensis TaxID=3404796 RepID=UPI00361C4DA2